VSNHNACFRELGDLCPQDFAIVRGQVQAVLAERFDDAKGIRDAGDFQQSLYHRFADLVLAQGVEISLVYRAAGRQDNERRDGIAWIESGGHGLSVPGVICLEPGEDEVLPERFQDLRGSPLQPSLTPPAAPFGREGGYNA
jgi:hypothetical protein